jgi:hypothetical protein
MGQFVLTGSQQFGLLSNIRRGVAVQSWRHFQVTN